MQCVEGLHFSVFIYNAGCLNAGLYVTGTAHTVTLNVILNTLEKLKYPRKIVFARQKII